MPRKAGMAFMIEFVEEYLRGDMDRMGFDLDFNHYLIKHYPRMERENSELAECFAFYLGEDGLDRTVGLSDAEHKALIRDKFDDFLSVIRDGLY